MSKIKDLRIRIEQLKHIENNAKYPDDIILAGWLKRRLQIRFVELMFPKPKDLQIRNIYSN